MAVLAITAVALIVRVLYVGDVLDSALLRLPRGEGAVFERWGLGHFSGIEVFPRAPLFGWVIALAGKFAEPSLAVRWINVALSTLTVGISASLAGRLGGTLAAVVTGLALALLWPAILFVGDPIPTSLAMFLAAVALSGLVRSGGGHRGWAVVGAMAAGLSSITVPWTVGWAVPFAAAGRAAWPRSRTRGGLLLVTLVLLPALAVSARNGLKGGTWAVSSQVRAELALNTQADGGSPDVMVPPARDPGPQPLVTAQSGAATEGGSSSWWAHLPGRAWTLLSGAEHGHGTNLYFLRDQSPTLRLPVYVGWWLLVAGGVLTVFLATDRRALAATLGLLAVGSAALIFLVVDSAARLPLAVPLALLTGVGVAQARVAWRERRGRFPLTALLSVVVLGVGLVQDLRHPDRALGEDGRSLGMRAAARLRTGAPDAAVTDLVAGIQAARRAGDTPLEDALRRDFSRVLGRLRRLDDMEFELEGLQARYPDEATLIALRGEFFRIKGNVVAARQRFTRAVELDPRTADARAGLGWVHISDNRSYLSTAHFRAVLALDHRDVRGMAGLAWIALHDNDDEERAFRLARQALAIDRAYAPAHHVIGDIYRARKDLAAAVWHYREAFRLDPLNVKVQIWLNRSGVGNQHPPGAEDDMP